jgi:hypothetical protein
MTTPVTRQPRYPLIRRAMTLPGRGIGILGYLHDELLAAGDAMACSNRFPQPRPQAKVTPAQPAPAGKALTGV